MIESKFSNKFAKLAAEGSDLFELRGSSIIVELLPEPEMKTAGGIIIAQDKNQLHGSVLQHKATVGLVLAVGAGFYDPETGKDIPLEVEVGDVLLLPTFSITLLSNFPGLEGITGNSLGLVKDESILFRYKGQEAFEVASRLLND